MSYKIDVSNPNNLNNNVLPEQETRRRFIIAAKKLGLEKDLILIFEKYDKLLRNCTNVKERADIAKLGAVEVLFLLGKGGELYVDGQLVYKDK
jgi:hypothetical protein